jgi:WhiB family redox-sensing transcriptional regulator
LGLSDVGLHPGLDDMRLLPGGRRVTDWRKLAACIGKPSEWFFHFSESNPYYEARATCAECPVRRTCLEENLREPDGFWGGKSPRERRRIIRLRRRAAE